MHVVCLLKEEDCVKLAYHGHKPRAVVEDKKWWYNTNKYPFTLKET